MWDSNLNFSRTLFAEKSDNISIAHTLHACFFLLSYRYYCWCWCLVVRNSDEWLFDNSNLVNCLFVTLCQSSSFHSFLMMAHNFSFFFSCRRHEFYSIFKWENFFFIVLSILCIALTWIPWGFEYILQEKPKMTQEYSVHFAYLS